MSEKTYQAAIYGVTGLVGRELLQILLQDSNCESVNAFVRKASLPPHPKLSEILVDYENILNFSEAMKVDRSFCCLGTTRKAAGSREAFAAVDRDLVIKIARISSQLGVQHFSVLSSIGASSSSPVFYLRVKAQMEKAILEMPFRSVHIFRPSLLLGRRERIRPVEIIFQSFFNRIGFLLPKRYQGVTADQVAAAMHSAAYELDGKKIFESEALQLGKEITSLLLEEKTRQI